MNNYQNIYKHISPPFNPGVRTWQGVDPEKYIVDYSYRLGPNANTAEMMTHGPYHQVAGNERVEGFRNVVNNKIFRDILVLTAVCYIIYYVLNMSGQKSQYRF